MNILNFLAHSVERNQNPKIVYGLKTIHMLKLQGLKDL